MASPIRLSEIVATSSCFPGIFEPIVFPDDFKLYKDAHIKKLLLDAKLKSVNLMDGGIVDNQGIEYVEVAEQQIETEENNTRTAIDLIIISDVAHLKMKSFDVSLKHVWLNATMRSVVNIIHTLTLISIVSTIIFYVFHSSFWTGFMLAISIVFLSLSCMIEFVLIANIKKKLKGTHFAKDRNKFLRIKVRNLVNLSIRRISSLFRLANGVFLKRIRQLSYHKIYDNPKWENRRLSSLLYLLNGKIDGGWQTKMKKDKLPEVLGPSILIQNNNDKAYSMNTTLWFTDKVIKDGIPESLVASGQYTICWSLLRYIHQLKKSATEINENYKLIVACETQLLEDWERFQSDPMWLFKEKIQK